MISRYLEPSRPERFYRYPTTEVITDPLKVTATSLGVMLVDKLVAGGSRTGDIAEISAAISGVTSLIGGWAYFHIRALDEVEQSRAEQRNRRLEGGQS